MPNEKNDGKATEGGPLKGGKPIDPARRDPPPHPTEEAERRSRQVQSGDAAGASKTEGD